MRVELTSSGLSGPKHAALYTFCSVSPTFVGNSFPIICMFLPAVRRTAKSEVLLHANGAKRARDLQYEGCRGLWISFREERGVV